MSDTTFGTSGSALSGAASGYAAPASMTFDQMQKQILQQRRNQIVSDLMGQNKAPQAPWDYTQGLSDVKSELAHAQSRLLAGGVSISDIQKAQEDDQDPWWMSGVKRLSDVAVAMDWLFLDAPVRTLLGGGLVKGAQIDKYAEELGTHAPTGKELLLKWGWMDQEADRKGQIDLIDVMGLATEIAMSPQTWWSLGTTQATEAALKGGSVALRETSYETLRGLGTNMAKKLAGSVDDIAEITPELAQAFAEAGLRDLGKQVAPDELSKVGGLIYELARSDTLYETLGDGTKALSTKAVVEKLRAAERLQELGLGDDLVKDFSKELEVARTGLWTTDQKELAHMMGYSVDELRENPELAKEVERLTKRGGDVMQTAIEGDVLFKELQTRTAERLGDPGGLRFGPMILRDMAAKTAADGSVMTGSKWSKSLITSRQFQEWGERSGLTGLSKFMSETRPVRAMYRTFVADWRIKDLQRDDAPLGNALMGIKRAARARFDNDLKTGIDGVVNVMRDMKNGGEEITSMFGGLSRKETRQELLKFLELPAELRIHLGTIIDETPLNFIRDLHSSLGRLPQELGDPAVPVMARNEAGDMVEQYGGTVVDFLDRATGARTPRNFSELSRGEIASHYLDVFEQDLARVGVEESDLGKVLGLAKSLDDEGRDNLVLGLVEAARSDAGKAARDLQMSVDDIDKAARNAARSRTWQELIDDPAHPEITQPQGAMKAMPTKTIPNPEYVAALDEMGVAWKDRKTVSVVDKAGNKVADKIENPVYKVFEERLGTFDHYDHYFSTLAIDNPTEYQRVTSWLENDLRYVGFRAQSYELMPGDLDSLTPRQMKEYAAKLRGTFDAMDASKKGSAVLDLAYQIGDLTRGLKGVADEIASVIEPVNDLFTGQRTGAANAVTDLYRGARPNPTVTIESQRMAVGAQALEGSLRSYHDTLNDRVLELIDMLKAPTKQGDEVFERELKTAIAYQNEVLAVRRAQTAELGPTGDLAQQIFPAAGEAPRMPAFSWNRAGWTPDAYVMAENGVRDRSVLQYAAERAANQDAALMLVDGDTALAVRQRIEDMAANAAGSTKLDLSDTLIWMGDSARRAPAWTSVSEGTNALEHGFLTADIDNDLKVPAVRLYETAREAVEGTGKSQPVLVAARVKKPYILMGELPASPFDAVLEVEGSANPIRIVDLPDHGYDSIMDFDNRRMWALPQADSFHSAMSQDYQDAASAAMAAGSQDPVFPMGYTTAHADPSARPILATYRVDTGDKRIPHLTSGKISGLGTTIISGGEAEAIRRGVKTTGKAYTQRLTDHLDSLGLDGYQGLVSANDLENFIPSLRVVDSAVGSTWNDVEQLSAQAMKDASLKGFRMDYTTKGIWGALYAGQSAEEVNNILRRGGLSDSFIERFNAIQSAWSGEMPRGTRPAWRIGDAGVNASIERASVDLSSLDRQIADSEAILSRLNDPEKKAALASEIADLNAQRVATEAVGNDPGYLYHSTTAPRDNILAGGLLPESGNGAQTYFTPQAQRPVNWKGPGNYEFGYGTEQYRVRREALDAAALSEGANDGLRYGAPVPPSDLEHFDRAAGEWRPLTEPRTQAARGASSRAKFEGAISVGKVGDIITDPILRKQIGKDLLEKDIILQSMTAGPGSVVYGYQAPGGTASGWKSLVDATPEERVAVQRVTEFLNVRRNIKHPYTGNKTEQLAALMADLATVNDAMKAGRVVGKTSGLPFENAIIALNPFVQTRVGVGESPQAATDLLETIAHEMKHLAENYKTGIEPFHSTELQYAADARWGSSFAAPHFHDLYLQSPTEVRAREAGTAAAERIATSEAYEKASAAISKIRDSLGESLDAHMNGIRYKAEVDAVAQTGALDDVVAWRDLGDDIKNAVAAMHSGEAPQVAVSGLKPEAIETAMRQYHRIKSAMLESGYSFSAEAGKNLDKQLPEIGALADKSTDVLRTVNSDDIFENLTLRKLEMPYFDLVPRKMMVGGVEKEVPEPVRKAAVRSMAMLEYYGTELENRGLTIDDLLDGWLAGHDSNLVNLPTQIGATREAIAPASYNVGPARGWTGAEITVPGDASIAFNNRYSNPAAWSRVSDELGIKGEDLAKVREVMLEWEKVAGTDPAWADLTGPARYRAMQEWMGERLGVHPSKWGDIDLFEMNTQAGNYFPHIAADDSERSWLARVFLSAEQESPRQLYPQRPMTTKMQNIDYSRTLKGTIEQINNVVGRQMFYDDPAKAMSVYIQRAVKSINTYDFLQDLKLLRTKVGDFAVRPAMYVNGEWVAPEGFRVFQIPEMRETARTLKKAGGGDIHAALMGMAEKYGDNGVLSAYREAGGIRYMATDTIVEEVEAASKQFITDGDFNGFLRTFDKVQGVWKTWATIARPGFHVRNATTNVWQNFIAGVTNPARYYEAVKIERMGMEADKFIAEQFAETGRMLDIEGAFQALGHSGSLELPGGETVSFAKLWRDMKETGTVGSGRMGSDIHILTSQRLEELDPIRGAWNPTSEAFAPVAWSRDFGTAVENNARIAHFIQRYGETRDAQAAAWSVRKYLFDYGELTETERNVFKRAMPFYAWVRKNTELQLETLVKRPFYTTTAIRTMDWADRTSNITEQPKWAQEIGAFGLPGVTVGDLNGVLNKVSGGLLSLDEKAETPMMLNVGLPMNDLLQLNPKDLFSALSPLVKAPVELVTNNQVYFGKPIWNYPGELAKAPSDLEFINEVVQKHGSSEQKVGWQRIADAVGFGIVKNDETGADELRTAPWFTYFWQTFAPQMRAYGRAAENDDEKQASYILALLSGVKFIPSDQTVNGYFNTRDEAKALQDYIKALQSQGKEIPAWGDTDAYTAEQEAKTAARRAEKAASGEDEVEAAKRAAIRDALDRAGIK